MLFDSGPVWRSVSGSSGVAGRQGFFRPEIFDHLGEGEDLVEDAIVRLVPQRRVLAYPYKGYWSPADTVKERAQLEDMYQKGNCPWMVWDPERSGQLPAAAPASAEQGSGVAAQASGLIG